VAKTKLNRLDKTEVWNLKYPEDINQISVVWGKKKDSSNKLIKSKLADNIALQYEQIYHL